MWAVWAFAPLVIIIMEWNKIEQIKSLLTVIFLLLLPLNPWIVSVDTKLKGTPSQMTNGFKTSQPYKDSIHSCFRSLNTLAVEKRVSLIANTPSRATPFSCKVVFPLNAFDVRYVHDGKHLHGSSMRKAAIFTKTKYRNKGVDYHSCVILQIESELLCHPENRMSVKLWIDVVIPLPCPYFFFFFIAVKANDWSKAKNQRTESKHGSRLECAFVKLNWTTAADSHRQTKSRFLWFISSEF